MANIIMELPTVTAAVNMRANRVRLKPGELGESIGTDGRVVGSVKKYPGMLFLSNLGYINQGGAALVNVKWMKSFCVQKGTTNFALRGWIVLHSVAAVYRITAFYYDDDTGRAEWTFKVLMIHNTDIGDGTLVNLTATSTVDSDGNGRYLYITVLGDDATTHFNTAAAGADSTGSWTSAKTGIDMAVYGGGALTAPGTAEQADGGFLSAGDYRVGFRYYDSLRRRYSELATTTITIADVDTNGDSHVHLTKGGAETPFTAGFDYVEVYRSLSVEVAGSVYDAGLMWREAAYAITNDAWAPSSPLDVGVISDLALTMQRADGSPWDATLDGVGSPPDSGCVGVYEGTTFQGSDSTAGSVVTQMQFSSVRYYRPEIFPIGNIFRWSSEDGQVIRFVKVGDLMYAWTPNAVFRLTKMGAQLILSRLHGGRGLSGRAAVSAVGRDMVAVTPLGLMLVNGRTGAMQIVSAVDRVLSTNGDWGADVGGIVMASDGKLGATFIINPTDEEAIVLWHTTSALTMLEDCNYVWATEGIHPVDGGPSRAWFIDAIGNMYYPDDVGAHNSMRGLDPAAVEVNGEVTGCATGTGDDNDLLMTGAAWTTRILKGAKVYLWDQDDPNSPPQVRTISSATTGELTVAPTFDPAPATGDRFTIAPVPFKVRLAPLRHPDPRMQDFGRRTTTAIGVHALQFSGGAVVPASDPNASFRLGVCRNLDETSPPSSQAAMATFDPDPAGTEKFQQLNADGVVLEPYVEHIGADTNFELLSVLMNVTMTSNRQIGT